MPKALLILGVLQILGGIVVTMVAKSAIHEILGAISFGMGVLAIGLSAIITKLEEVKKEIQGRPHVVPAL